MLLRLKRSFDEGMERIRWYSSILSERLKVEVAVIKMLKDSDQLEKRRAELIATIGERVFGLRSISDLNIMSDSNIKSALKELEELDKELDELKEQVSEIGQAD